MTPLEGFLTPKNITQFWLDAFILFFAKATLLDFAMVKKTSAAACIGLGGSAPEQKKSRKTKVS